MKVLHKNPTPVFGHICFNVDIRKLKEMNEVGRTGTANMVWAGWLMSLTEFMTLIVFEDQNPHSLGRGR